MHYIAIAHFPKDPKSLSDIASRRRTYRYPAAFANVQSYLDVQGGRAIVHFETEDAKAILRYTADWPFERFALFQAVNQVLHGILMWRSDGRSRYSVRHRYLPCLDRHVVVVVIAADRALGTGDDEAALRLRLDGPGISER